MTVVDPPSIPVGTNLPPEVVRTLQQWREVIRRLLIRTGGSTDKLSYITITQEVDLDTMETDVASSKTKTDLISITQAVNLDTLESAVTALEGLTITAGAGLTGGGDLSDDRTLDVGAGTGISVTADAVSTDDAAIVHDALSGFVANEHIDHSAVTLTAGNGLTGGGTIESNRSFEIDTDVVIDKSGISSYSFLNLSTDRSFDANAAAGSISSTPTQAEVENIRDAVLEIADVVGTLVTDLSLT